jgi:hypothetical protein
MLTTGWSNWIKGYFDGLKIRCQKWCEGSSPSPGTIKRSKEVQESPGLSISISKIKQFVGRAAIDKLRTGLIRRAQPALQNARFIHNRNYSDFR